MVSPSTLGKSGSSAVIPTRGRRVKYSWGPTNPKRKNTSNTAAGGSAVDQCASTLRASTSTRMNEIMWSLVRATCVSMRSLSRPFLLTSWEISRSMTAHRHRRNDIFVVVHVYSNFSSSTLIAKVTLGDARFNNCAVSLVGTIARTKSCDFVRLAHQGSKSIRPAYRRSHVRRLDVLRATSRRLCHGFASDMRHSQEFHATFFNRQIITVGTGTMTSVSTTSVTYSWFAGPGRTGCRMNSKSQHDDNGMSGCPRWLGVVSSP